MHSVYLSCVQNVTNLLMYTELPDTSVRQVHPILLQGWYSVLRRVESTGHSLFVSRPVPACRDSRPQSDSSAFYDRGVANSEEKVHRCYWLGYTLRNFH